MSQINAALHHMQKELTSHSHNSSLTRPVQEKPAKLLHQEAIQEIELAKGKAYSEVLVKLYSYLSRDHMEMKVRAYIKRLANLFDEYGCSDEGVVRVVRKCREAKFEGTSFSPLPEESAIIRIIKEVNSSMVTETKIAQGPAHRYTINDDLPIKSKFAAWYMEDRERRKLEQAEKNVSISEVR